MTLSSASILRRSTASASSEGQGSDFWLYSDDVTRPVEESNRWMLRARDAVDRTENRRNRRQIVAPTCFTMAWMRPSSFGEAPAALGSVASGSC